MSENQQLELLTLFFNIALLVLVYLVPYRRTRRDYFREDLFSIRDELFDYMWRNHISYELLAYGRLRYTLNGMIRSLDETNLAALVGLSFAYRHSPQSDLIAEAITDIEDPGMKQHFVSVYAELRTRTVHYFYLEGWQWLVFKPLQLLTRYARLRQFGKLGVLLEQCYTWIYTKMDQWTNQCLFLGKSHSPEAQMMFDDPPASVLSLP